MFQTMLGSCCSTPHGSSLGNDPLVKQMNAEDRFHDAAIPTHPGWTGCHSLHISGEAKEDYQYQAIVGGNTVLT